MAKKKSVEDYILEYNQRANSWSNFLELARTDTCLRDAVCSEYELSKSLRWTELNDSAKRVTDRFKTDVDPNRMNPDVDNNVYDAANYIWTHNLKDSIFSKCAASKAGTPPVTPPAKSTGSSPADYTKNTGPRPFDRRLDRLEMSMANADGQQTTVWKRITPFSSAFADVTTSGYLMTDEAFEEAVKNMKNSNIEAARKKLKDQRAEMQKNEFYKGVPALQNNYALIRLYGSDGGKYLMNQKNQRRWYEIDVTTTEDYNFASTPTTSALISWGNGDPYGRTPYAFTDFVFSKYWNKIQNNRLITLRRYPAPILDNLKFPGMKGGTDYGKADSDTTGGSQKDEAIPFQPMSSAITYFGGDTGNNLSKLLAFTTGVKWEDLQAQVWEVNTESVPENETLGNGMFKGIGRFAEMLNVAAGNKFNPEFITAGGHLPPDPYSNGPYENRIQGPVNRIDTIKKRKPGMEFQWEGLNLVFEYVARPVGGINPKAVLLDILSNFLIMGSASAVFFGGAHRFMADPNKYPLLGGDKGIKALYEGKPIQFGINTIQQFTGSGGTGKTAATSLLDSAKAFIDQLFSGEKGSGFGALTTLFTGASGRLLTNEIAKKAAGQVPYLTGMRAILTGEPVGEWHVTIGNPLNPIAMIGNLICEGIDVEFNEELGPDDFPTEMKITVKLKHGMPRDRDAIESIFNRGMGRIYNLPDSMLGTADMETKVDANTGGVQTGKMPDPRKNYKYSQDLTGRIVGPEISGIPNALSGNVSVWNRQAFSLGISENSDIQVSTNELFLSAYRATNWIAQKSLT